MKKTLKKLKKYFIPHLENEFKPHFLRGKSILLMISVAILLFLISFAFKQFILTSENFASIISSVLVDLTNHDRQASQIRPLSINPVLTLAAQSKANDMASKGYFAHTSPDGLNPWYWFEKVGYNFSYAGENLAVNFSDSKDVEQAWMNSPKHRENIMNGNFTEIGIATAKGTYDGREAVFVVQMFGKPYVPAPVPKKEISLATPPPSAPAKTEQGKTEVITNEENFLAVKNDNAQPENVAGAASNVNEAATAPPSAPYSSEIAKIVTSPRNTLDYIYAILGLIVFTSLILATVIEIKKQSPRHILYALSFISIIVLLICFNQLFIYPQVMIR